ncbi:MAG: thiamine phosphate synthase [Acidimicrobiia bacterium]|nr:thiamine phosphate synthase [Acidimicrobiia bacterium]
MRPVICMITDRRRYGPHWEDALVERVGAAARAGVHLIQVRERDLDGGILTRLVTRCVEAVGGTRARILVNDRVDVALAAGAHGVHLPGEAPPAPRVRSCTPPAFLVGRSVHALDEARGVSSAGGTDFLIFGTVYETASKPGAPSAGPCLLAQVAQATAHPVLAVGGVTLDRIGLLRAAGAAGFAAIGLFADCRPEHLQVLVGQASMAFDTPRPVP